MALIFSVIAISALVDLPLALYHRFVIEEKFGFNRMTFKLFVSDLLKQAALGLIIGTPALLAVLWLMAKMGSLWWLYVWPVSYTHLDVYKRQMYKWPRWSLKKPSD